MRPKLSIVTITYKDPKGLRETLLSLLQLKASAPFSWESIVVDGSPDVNSSIIAEFKELPIRHHAEQPQGVYKALNSGYAQAAGEYLWFLNGGDALTNPIFLKDVIDVMDDEKTDIYCCSTVFGSEQIRQPRSTFIRSILGKNLISHPAMIYRAQSFKNVGAFSMNYKIAADYDHHFRCYFAGLKIRTNPTILVRVEPGGISDSDWKKSLKEMRAIMTENKEKLKFMQYAYGILRIYYEYCRIAFRKWVSASAAGPFLKKTIQKWKDLKY